MMHNRKILIEVAMKKHPADMIIKNGQIINVYSGEILKGNVAIHKDRIAYVGTQEALADENTQIIDAEGYYLSPGYFEPHGHLWIAANPVEWAKACLLHGVTTSTSDVAGFIAVQGRKNFKKMISDLANYPFNFCWNINIMYPTPVSDEERVFKNIGEIFDSREVTGIGEIPRWMKIIQGDEHVLKEIERCIDQRKVVEGHTAGTNYEKLNGVVAGGVSGDHEAINTAQALDRLRLGLWTMLRHSSLRRDLPDWVSILKDDKIFWDRLMFTTDGSSPMYTDEYGLIDNILTNLVAEGVDAIKALKMATLNPAVFYRLDGEVGGIAPGRRADILFLDSLKNFKPQKVISGGKLMVDKGRMTGKWPIPKWQEWGLTSPFLEGNWASNQELYEMSVKDKRVEGYPVMNLVSTVITRPMFVDLPEKDGKVYIDNSKDIHHISLIHKEGVWGTKSLIKGFAKNIEAYACSYSVNGNIIVIGKSPASMAKAAQRLVDIGGGIVLIENGSIAHEIPLKIAGIMSEGTFSEIVNQLKEMEELLKSRGYVYDDFLYTSLFLPCDHLPDWRLTEYGLLDVKANKII